MGKYGKKNEVSLNPLDYNICLLGESGIGKSTIIKEMCEKLVGSDGYLHLDIGREDGRFSIQGIISEPVEDYEKMRDIVDDIIENKYTDYPELKVVVWDTLDELIPILEEETVREWNKGKPADKKAETCNGAYGGFQHGQEHAINLLLDAIWNLKKVGVSSIIIAHVKRSELTDPVTQEVYSKLTADTTQKYFGWIKNKMHFVGLAYIDRNIVKENTGRKDIKGKDITVSKAISESRVISFRDNTYAVDSKSRFANIVDQVPFDVDAFIKAMQDAIIAERLKGGGTLEEAEAQQKVREDNKESKAKEYSSKAKEVAAIEGNREEFINKIQSAWNNATAEQKEKAKTLRDAAGFSKYTEADGVTLKAIAELF